MSGRIPSRGSDQFNLRFPDGMRDRIAEEAAANGRSMNAEIIARLERSLNGPSIDDPLLRESDLALTRQIHDRSQRTLLDISAQAERITSAVELLLSKDEDKTVAKPKPTPPATVGED